MKGSLINQLG